MKSETAIETMDCYADLQPWAAELCETAYQKSIEHGRRRRASREDFVPGWKEAALQFGRTDVFVGRPEPVDRIE